MSSEASTSKLQHRTGGTRRTRFIELANLKRGEPKGTEELDDDETKEKVREREALDRRVRARTRVEFLKALWERPGVQEGLYTLSSGIGILWITYLLAYGEF
jgi:hypothetical protein